jgi:hypothetical protein
MTAQTKKVIYIIPGFKQKPTNKAYKAIISILKKEGYLPIPITIPWKQTTISENTEFFLKQFRKNKLKNKSILGFSYGAMIAFVASTQVSVADLILCSLSPYFKEDVTRTGNKLASTIPLKRYKDFKKLHAGTLARQIKAKNTLMLYGKDESKPLIKRVTRAYNQIPSLRKYLIPIAKTEHDIGDSNYLRTIHQAAKELL